MLKEQNVSEIDLLVVYFSAFISSRKVPNFKTCSSFQLHIKIKQDLEGLVDGIVGPIKSLIPGKKKTPAVSSSYAEPEPAYQLVPATSYQPVEAPTSYDPGDNPIKP